ncbi:envelope stress response membrane protein PspC [Desulfospira joergensenii]|uniref:envelope stress response membrane protein PspC n=1 Tax=Desulfospira joergensenii TaxID=53329 RepID=UPI0003B3541C|nr:envelope stress response membrane protein PspC [Desulfospira joergensenii]
MRHNFKGGFRRPGQFSRFGSRCSHQDIFRNRNGLFNCPVYRSRRGIFMGVCRGLAEYFNLNVFWLRVVVFFIFLFTGFWPIGVLYIVAGLIMKMEPVIPLRDEKEHEFYQSYTTSRESAIQRIKRKFENIDRRIQRMEDTVTSREFEL